MTTVKLSAASAYGHSPECLRWMEAQGADWHDVYEVLIDTEAQTLTIHRFARNEAGHCYCRPDGTPATAPVEARPLLSLPDPIDLLVVMDRAAQAKARLQAHRVVVPEP